MADITAFPDLEDIVSGDDSLLLSDKGPFETFTFHVATSAGQVVVYHSTSGEVTPATGSVSEKVAGVAMYDVAAGAKGVVAMAGNIVKVVNASGSVAIDGGAWLITDDNAVLGTVSELSLTRTSTAYLYCNVVGQAIEDIAAGGYGFAYLCTTPISVPIS